MKPRILGVLSAIALVAVAGAAKADQKTASVNAKRLGALKQLAGDWVEVGKDGKPTAKVISSFRVTARGTAVQETLFPGSDHEMVTMYHLDGEDLILTHYCALGNQPRMRAEPGPDVHTIAFKFIGGTNLKSNDDHHMHQATLTLRDKDHFQAEWISSKEGKTCHQVRFSLVRKSK
jgi:hypothetical protein